MSTVRIVLCLVAISFCFFAQAQQVTIGPLITPDKCAPDPNGLTTVCYATDGVHVSLGGKPFGGPIGGAQGPPGPPGPQGDRGFDGKDGGPGADATISIGTVETGDPGTWTTVTNDGTPGHAIFNFKIPRGDKGDKGDAGVLFPVSVVLTCEPAPNASVPKGFTTKCVLSLP